MPTQPAEEKYTDIDFHTFSNAFSVRRMVDQEHAPILFATLQQAINARDDRRMTREARRQRERAEQRVRINAN
jgi:hypothetical protein